MSSVNRRQFAVGLAAGVASAQTRPVDVAIVGAGVFGAWISLECNRLGKSVALIDSRGPGNSLSSSGDESRILRVGYGPQVFYSNWARNSIDEWRNVLAGLGQPDLMVQSGMLWVGLEGDTYLQATASTLKQLSVPFHLLGPKDLRSRFPHMVVDQRSMGILEEKSGYVLARRALQQIVRNLEKRGVVYRQSLIRKPVPVHGKLLEIHGFDNLSIVARQFVFACGPWLPKVFPDVLGDLILPTRQEVFYFAAPTGEPVTGPPTNMAWVDFRPDRIFYGTPDIEHRGFKVAADRHGKKFDPDSDDRLASAGGLAEVRDFIHERFPLLSSQACVETRVCQYENTSSGDFLIDRHPKRRISSLSVAVRVTDLNMARHWVLT